MKTNALPPTSQPTGAPPAMSPNVHGQSLDVLLIEDNPGDVVLLRAMFAETTSPYLNLAHGVTPGTLLTY